MKHRKPARAIQSQTPKRESPRKEPPPELPAKMTACTFMWPMTPEAKAVQLAGDFTSWTPIPLEKAGNGFQADVLLPPGEYRYKFIVDGEWCNDPVAVERVPNGFGTTDSVLRVN